MNQPEKKGEEVIEEKVKSNKEKVSTDKKDDKKPMTNQAKYTQVKKRNSFNPKGGNQNKGRGNYYTLLDILESSASEEDSEEDIQEIELETAEIAPAPDLGDHGEEDPITAATATLRPARASWIARSVSTIGCLPLARASLRRLPKRARSALRRPSSATSAAAS